MPDLAVHLSAAAVARRALPGTAARMGLLLGTCLPDIGYKGLNVVLGVPRDLAIVADTPVGALLLSYIACFLFVEEERRAAFGGLVAGSLLHLLLDSCKAHLGVGGIIVGLPLHWEAYGLGLYSPEQSVYATVPAVALALGFEWWMRRREGPPGRGAKPPPGPGGSTPAPAAPGGGE